MFAHNLDEKLDLNLNGSIFSLAGTLQSDGIMGMLEFLFCKFLLDS